MKICTKHWDMLKAALELRGILHLAHKSGEELVEYIQRSAEGVTGDYDPLFDCNNMITCNALQSGGLYLMGKPPEGEHFCPICEAVAHNCGSEAFWLDSPADASLAYCREQGLVPKAH